MNLNIEKKDGKEININYKYCYNYLKRYEENNSQSEIILLFSQLEETGDIPVIKNKSLHINVSKFFLQSDRIIFIKNNKISNNPVLLDENNNLLELTNDNIIIYLSKYIKFKLSWKSIDSFRIYRKSRL